MVAEPVVEGPVVEEPVGEEALVVPVVVTEEGVPQYGGTLTGIHWSGNTAGIPDPVTWPAQMYLGPVSDMLLVRNIEEYGWTTTADVVGEIEGSLKFYKGWVVDSWEVTADKITFEVRPGIYWAAEGREHIMESREYTAQDLVFNILYRFGAKAEADIPWSPWMKYVLPTELATESRLLLLPGYDEDAYWPIAYAEDKYTAVIETNFFDSEWWYRLTTFHGREFPREMVIAGSDKWENLIGTGPFILTEHVPGSHIEYRRNPNYYGTTTINGVEYPLPFVDTFVMPIMADEPTMFAALKTGVLDIHMLVNATYKAKLAQTNPELQFTYFPLGGTNLVNFRVDMPPFDDVNVRRAMFIGTDRATITKAAFLVDPIEHLWPIHRSTEGSVPIAELPASAKLLYTYDPVEAKRLLALAGYPDGFEAEMTAVAWEFLPEAAEMLVGLWEEELGVTVTITVVEPAAWSAITAAGEHPAIAFDWMTTSTIKQLRDRYLTTSELNQTYYSDAYFDAQVIKALATIDTEERVAILEELFIQITDEALAIPFGWIATWSYWWPWVKNFYGNMRRLPDAAYDYAWIDQTLKAEMGY